MQNKTSGLQRLTYYLIILLITGYLLIIGSSLFLPLAFAILFAILLLPVVSFLERFIPQRHTAILLSFIIALIPVVGIGLGFGFQLASIIKNIPSLSNRVVEGLNEALHWLEDTADVSLDESRQWIVENFSTIIDTPLQLLTSSLTSSTTLFASLLFMALITFFLLLYRTSFRNFLLSQVSRKQRSETRKILQDIQTVVQKYLYGTLFVILILGVVNSTGLWLIGIGYPFFWGFLAAFLAIIPYIGTTLGGVLPFLYALATAGTFWQPAAVVLLYVTVQAMEGNLITPKVVGGSVNLNPLVAILALFLWGMVWGIAGLILALPVTAILKVVMSHVDALRPLSELLSDGLYARKDIFLEKYDEDKYRLGRFFRKDK